MMTRIHIVTDSGARFLNPASLDSKYITILPYKLHIDGKDYREDIDLSPSETFALLGSQSSPPQIIAPTVAEYVETFRQLAMKYDSILSIHTSKHLSQSWENAIEASKHMIGCEIIVIDSMNICVAQAMLVQVALKSIQQNMSFDDTIQLLRGAIDRIYSIYHVGMTKSLSHHKVMSASHVLLGQLLNIKPFLTIDNGKLVAIEKAKTRSQVTDRMIEFLLEFVDIEDAMIIQSKVQLTDQSRTIQDRFSLEFDGYRCPFMMYGMLMASFVGLQATGVAILEADSELEQDDF